MTKRNFSYICTGDLNSSAMEQGIKATSGMKINRSPQKEGTEIFVLSNDKIKIRNLKSHG